MDLQFVVDVTATKHEANFTTRYDLRFDVRRIVGWKKTYRDSKPAWQPILDTGVALDHAVDDLGRAVVEARLRELAAPQKIVG